MSRDNMADRPETYQERIRAQMRDELAGEIRYEFAQELISALKPALARDVTQQKVINMISDMV